MTTNLLDLYRLLITSFHIKYFGYSHHIIYKFYYKNSLLKRKILTHTHLSLFITTKKMYINSCLYMNYLQFKLTKRHWTPFNRFGNVLRYVFRFVYIALLSRLARIYKWNLAYTGILFEIRIYGYLCTVCTHVYKTNWIARKFCFFLIEL